MIIQFIAFVLVLAWAVIVTHQVNHTQNRLVRLVKDVNGEFGKVAQGFKLINLRIEGRQVYLQNKFKIALQAKFDSLKSRIQNVKDALGNIKGRWSATATEICDDCSPELPTVAERLAGMEELMGIEFKHSVEETRGYVPSQPDCKAFVGVNDNTPTVNYPVKRRK